METSTEMIILAVSVIITVLIITIAFNLASSAREIPNNVISQINQTNDSLESWQYTKYCEADCDGNEVLSALRKFNDDSVGVAVIVQLTPDTPTSSGETRIYANNMYCELNEDEVDSGDCKKVDWSIFQNLPTNAYSIASDKDKVYVNPLSVFEAYVDKNDNGTIRSLIFEETEYKKVTTVSSSSEVGGNYASSKTKSASNEELNQYAGKSVMMGSEVLEVIKGSDQISAGIELILVPSGKAGSDGITKCIYANANYCKNNSNAIEIDWSSFSNAEVNAYVNTGNKKVCYVNPNSEFTVSHKTVDGNISELVFKEKSFSFPVEESEGFDKYSEYLDSSKVFTGAEVASAMRKFNDDSVSTGVWVWTAESNTDTNKQLYANKYGYHTGELHAKSSQTHLIDWSNFVNSSSNAFTLTGSKKMCYLNPNSEFTVTFETLTDGSVQSLVFTEKEFVDPKIEDGHVTYTSSNSGESSGKDLDVLFSDETKDIVKDNSSSESSKVEEFNRKLKKIQKNFDSISEKISAISENTKISTIKNYKKMVNEMSKEVSKLEKDYVSKDSFSLTNKKKFSKSISKLKVSLSSVMNALDELIKD